MEGIQREREAMERLAAQALGLDPRQPRQTAGQMRYSGLEGDLLSLPVDVSAWEPIQDASTGALYFVADLSVIDGDDLIM